MNGPPNFPNFERLLKLAAFLETLEHKQFDFALIVRAWHRDPETHAPCGSICCAIGWLPAVFPDLVRWSGGPPKEIGELFDDDFEPDVVLSGANQGDYEAMNFFAADKLFNLEGTESTRLFCPGKNLPWMYATKGEGHSLGSMATPQAVAESIREFCKWRETHTVWEVMRS
jgi:hypothetical protein